MTSFSSKGGQPIPHQHASTDDSGIDIVMGPKQGVLPPDMGFAIEGDPSVGTREPESSNPASAAQPRASLPAICESLGDVTSPWGTESPSAPGGLPLFEDSQPITPQLPGNAHDFLQLALRAVAESAVWPAGVRRGWPPMNGAIGAPLDVPGYQPVFGAGAPEPTGGLHQAPPAVLKKKGKYLAICQTLKAVASVGEFIHAIVEWEKPALAHHQHHAYGL